MACTNDVVVFSRTFEEHLNHLSIVLGKIQKGGLTICPDKVQLATSEINLLSFVVEKGTLRPNLENLEPITAFCT